MPIRLRKIQQSKQNVDSIRQQRARKNILWQRVRKLVGLLFFISIALYVYFAYYAPPSGIALIHASIDDIVSPTQAQIKWIVPSEGSDKIRLGDTVAILHELSSDIIEDEKRLNEAKNKFYNAKSSIDEIKTRQDIQEKSMRLKTIEFKLGVQLAEDALKRGLNQTKKATDIFNARKKEYENAKRLWNLDALTKGDLSASKRMFVDAETAYKNAFLFEKGLQSELDSARDLLSELVASNKLENDDFHKRLAAGEAYCKSVENQVVYIEKVIAGTADKDIVIKSPRSGDTLPRGWKKGDVVKKGELLLAVYRPASLKLIGCVPEKYKADIYLNQEVEVKLRRRIIQAVVTEIHPRIILAPSQLRKRGLAPENAYFFTVRLKPKESISNMFPGEFGKVIFK